MGKLKELLEGSISDLQNALATGATTSSEITAECLRHIESSAQEPINAYLELNRNEAIEQAAHADRRREHEETIGPLDGVPLAIKDNINCKGLGSRCASKILNGFISPYDATVIEKLRQAGAVILGKTNMDEFAMGSSNEHSAYGVVRNPHDINRVPGGSSGGSAAAVSAHQAFGALGSDTGGSIRQPAAFCGVVGLKPTYGRVSRYGLIAFANSLDQIGPLTRNVQDTAIILDAISGHDKRDATSAEKMPTAFQSALLEERRPLRIGVLKPSQEPGAESAGLAPSMQDAFSEAMRSLEHMGHTCSPVELPHNAYAIATYYLTCTAEAASNLARFDGVRYGYRAQDTEDLNAMYCKTRGEGFGTEVKRRIMLGTFALSAGYCDAFYGKAQSARTLICADYHAIFSSGVDIIITPTTPTPAFKFGACGEDPVQMYLADLFTVGASLAGLPALSIPCGKDADGLPLGLQMIAAPWREEILLQAAQQFEQAQGSRGHA